MAIDMIGTYLFFTGKAKPAQYIILPPGRYDENPYDIVHNTSNCITSVETILMGNREEDLTVVTCPYGELLLNGVTRVNLEDGVSDSDIRTFYTWEDMSLPMGINEAFVTLQFPNSTITPTRVALYFLEMRELRATEPQRVRLYSSTTASIFPEDDIRANDIQVTIESGTTNQNDDYEYIRYDLTIAEEDQVPLNYLRMELNFDPMTDWVFISEVEVYHLVEPCKSMLHCLVYTTIANNFCSAKYYLSASIHIIIDGPIKYRLTVHHDFNYNNYILK